MLSYTQHGLEVTHSDENTVYSLPVTPDSVIDSVYNEQTANYRSKKKPHKKKSAYKHPSRSDGKAWDIKFRLYESRWLCTSIKHKST